MLETGRGPLRMAQIGFDAEALALKLTEPFFSPLPLLGFSCALACLHELRAQLCQFGVELGEARAFAESGSPQVTQSFALALQVFLCADVYTERNDPGPGLCGALDQLFKSPQVAAGFDDEPRDPFIFGAQEVARPS